MSARKKRRVIALIIAAVVAAAAIGAGIVLSFVHTPGDIAKLERQSAEKPPPDGNVYRDVVYHRSIYGRFALDIYAPAPAVCSLEPEPAAPAVVFFHGGFLFI